MQKIDKPLAILTDLDSTLALLNRSPYTEQDKLMEDKLNVEVANVLKMYVNNGFKLLVLTGRWEQHYDLTLKWLKMHGFIPDKLFMRPYTNYDTGTRLKEWYLENIIIPNYTPVLAFDDMHAICKMYRKHDVQAWQVADESWESST